MASGRDSITAAEIFLIVRPVIAGERRSSSLARSVEDDLSEAAEGARDGQTRLHVAGKLQRIRALESGRITAGRRFFHDADQVGTGRVGDDHLNLAVVPGNDSLK